MNRKNTSSSLWRWLFCEIGPTDDRRHFFMSQRPTLDRSSFETLLFAAWVLQCQHEQDTRKRQPASALASQETPCTKIKEPLPAIRPSSVPWPLLRQQWELGTASVGQHAMRASHALQRAQSWFSSTAIAAAPYRQGAQAETVHPDSIPLKTSRKLGAAIFTRVSRFSKRDLDPGLRHASLWLMNVAAGAKNTLLHFTRYRVKVRVLLSPRRAVTAGAPLLVLPIMVALTLFLVWQPEHFRSVAATSGLNLASEQNAFRKVVIPPLQGTHKQITDRPASSVIQGLSRYEIPSLRRQAFYGDDSAALVMGMIYETGRYVPQSCAKAADWVKRSAIWGNAAAQYNLGLRYRDGDGLPANEDEARKWLQKAADNKYANAKAALETLPSRDASSTYAP